MAEKESISFKVQNVWKVCSVFWLYGQFWGSFQVLCRHYGRRNTLKT